MRYQPKDWNLRGINVVNTEPGAGVIPEPGGLPARTDTADLANVIRSFIAFQNAGYLSGQPFEGTYALLVKDARTLLRELDA